jgi:hypothetical protein
MAGPFDLTERIRNLDPRDQASLIRRLLQLESARLSLPFGSSRVPQRVAVRDGGEDGLALEVPEEVESRLPAGRSILQLKTTQDLKDLKTTLKRELRDAPRPKEMLEDGGHYIVVLSKDATGQEIDEIKDAMVEVAGEARRDQLEVWPIGVIEELCTTNAAVLVEFNMVPGLGVLPFDKWAAGQDSEIPNYVSDPERVAAIDQIRKAIRDESDPLILDLQGDAGVGKSRTIREALDVDDIKNLVVVGDGETVLSFIHYVITNPATECILFADEIDPSELDHLRKQILPAEGRIRLITAGLPGSSRDTVPSGKTDIQLTTLDPDALLRLIVEEAGLPEDRARWVTDISAGYPRLAIEVAKVIKEDPSAVTVGSAITNQNIHQVLDRMIPDEGLQRQLGIIALFSQVGVDGARQYEIKAVGEAFSIDYAVLTDTLENEVGRFVSRSGTLRSVTPKLVSVWLARKVLRSEGSEDAKKIQGLPQPLPDRFRDQLEFLRDAPAIKAVVTELLERPEFQDPAHFDDAAAGFLQAAAAVVPEQVAHILARVMESASDDDLEQDGIPRRELVWTLEYLLWPEETYEFAVSALLRLAEHETESFANNASGVLVDSFQSYLGGTVVPHSDRLAWLDKKWDEPLSDARRKLFARCAAAGLRVHQTRSHGTHVAESGVRDWRPTTGEELVAVIRGSWERLVKLAAEAKGDVREDVFSELADSVRLATTQGIADEVLEALADTAWSFEEKAKLAASLRDVLKYDKPDRERKERISNAIDSLMGESYAARLEVVLRSPLWELHEDDDWQSAPPIIKELAASAADNPEARATALKITATLEDQNTAYAFWTEVAGRMDPQALADESLGGDPTVIPAYQAALSAAATDDPAWVDEQLLESTEDPLRAEHVVQLVQAAGLTEGRADLLLAAIAASSVKAEALSQLLYGASVRSVNRDVALRLVKACASSETGIGLEHALGILHQYEEVEPDLLEDAEVQELAKQIATEALASAEGSSMRRHYAYELAKKLDPEKALGVLEARLRNDRTLPDRPELGLLQKAFTDDPGVATQWARELLESAVANKYERWATWAEKLHLLSEAGAVDPSGTLEWFEGQPDDAKRRLVRHINFGHAEPDAFLSALIEGADDEGLKEALAVAYYSSLGTIRGPYYLGLERQLERLRKWRKALGPKGRTWADQVIASYEKQIPAQKLRDEEEDALWQ